MKFLTKMIEAMQFAAEMRAREIVRREFMHMSDRQLEDIGISRERLEWGSGAWPWRHEGENAEPNLASTLSQAEAIRELNEYSDRELTDLGLARAGIADAVKHGKPDQDPLADHRAA